MSKIFTLILFSFIFVACASTYDADNVHHRFGFGQHVSIKDSIVNSHSNSLR